MFPDSYKQLLSIAYYLILEENNSMSRFSHWNRLHIHPCGTDIPSQRSSELFQNIDEASRMNFFKKQGMRRIEKEYWAFDTTSISRFSETLKQVKVGRNKENDRRLRSTLHSCSEKNQDCPSTTASLLVI